MPYYMRERTSSQSWSRVALSCVILVTEIELMENESTEVYDIIREYLFYLCENEAS